MSYGNKIPPAFGMECLFFVFYLCVQFRGYFPAAWGFAITNGHWPGGAWAFGYRRSAGGASLIIDGQFSLVAAGISKSNVLWHAVDGHWRSSGRFGHQPLCFLRMVFYGGFSDWRCGSCGECRSRPSRGAGGSEDHESVACFLEFRVFCHGFAGRVRSAAGRACGPAFKLDGACFGCVNAVVSGRVSASADPRRRS